MFMYFCDINLNVFIFSEMFVQSSTVFYFSLKARERLNYQTAEENSAVLCCMAHFVNCPVTLENLFIWPFISRIKSRNLKIICNLKTLWEKDTITNSKLSMKEYSFIMRNESITKNSKSSKFHKYHKILKNKIFLCCLTYYNTFPLQLWLHTLW